MKKYVWNHEEILAFYKEGQKSKTHIIYKNKKGTRLPGSTSIIGLREKPALKHWAWKLGCEGKKYWEESAKAANIGTVAHEMIKIYLRGLLGKATDKQVEEVIKAFTYEYAPAIVDKAENAYIAFLDWKVVHKLKPILIEEPLVSEEWQYGGTIDLYGEVDSSKDLVDFKTSKAIYPEHIVQACSYEKLLIENKYGVERTHILQINKEDGSFHHQTVADRKLPLEWFKRMRQVYAIDSKVFTKK